MSCALRSLATETPTRPASVTRERHTRRFRRGSRVRVKAGVRISQRPGVLMEGWAGTVIRHDKGRPCSCLVRWNAATLATVPQGLRRRYRQDWMYTDELQFNDGCVDATPNLWSATVPPGPGRGFGLSWNNQADRIRSVFGLDAGPPLPPVTPDSLERYVSYLQLHIADVSWLGGMYLSKNGYRTEGPFSIARDAHGDFEWDASGGVLCRFGRTEETMTVSLAQIGFLTNSPYGDLVDAYRCWQSLPHRPLSSPERVRYDGNGGST